MNSVNYCMEKKCSKCQCQKSVSEFYERKDIKSGLSPTCKSCESEKGKLWRKEREDHCKNYSKQKYLKQGKEILKKQKEKYAADSTLFLIRTKKWQRENAAKVRENQRKWREKNPERCAMKKARRRAKEKTHHLANIQAIRRIYKVCNFLSRKTKTRYQVDHIIPLSLGGIHHEGNLQIIQANLNKLKAASLSFRHSSVLHFTDLPPEVLALHPPEVIESIFREVNLPSPALETYR